ncbi:MAG TPA: sigma-54 dependent transcriptional regulator [Urbifossiella sp.]|jgi:DNA-binding NtrC family response regulator|nr:sigma-54 dependent transcriptional regulator [Urbifossiella sp.]
MSAAGPPLPSILVIDDEPIIRSNLAEFLQQEGFAVQTAASGELGLQMLARHKFDAVLCDVNLPGIDGLEVLERATQASPETFVLLITAYATVESAIDAFHKGVHDYLMKPIILKEVERKLRRLLAQRDLFRENQRLHRELNRANEAGEMVVGTTPVMQQVVAMARKAARTPTTVLITGDSGTGKELLARWIHAAAQDAQRPSRFVPINCAAIPADNVESFLFGCSDAGTLFLDEIGELPATAQAKLLRVIEQKESLPAGASEPRRLTARIIAATNKDLPKEVESGRFREDLFYRLNVVVLSLPPLRDRREDIPELVNHLLAKHVRALGKKIAGASHEALQILRPGAWKGNIRELENVLQRAVILGDGAMVTPADLPPDLAPRGDDPSAVDELTQAVERFEKLHIERILRQTADKREAAKRLGIGISSLYRKIEQYGIAAEGAK